MVAIREYDKSMRLIDNNRSLQLTVPKALVRVYGLKKGDRLRVHSNPCSFAERGLVMEVYQERDRQKNVSDCPVQSENEGMECRTNTGHLSDTDTSTGRTDKQMKTEK